MEYGQAEKIAKTYNEIQTNQNRLRELKAMIDLHTLHFARIKSFEEAEILLNYYTNKTQQLREELNI